MSLPILTVPPPAWVDPAKHVTITTPFVTLLHFVDAACADNGFSYLALTVHGNPNDPRIDDIAGDLTPEWGMHVIDVNVIMTVEKLDQKIEANVHLSGKDIHVQCNDGDMYAAIDALIDKLDRQVLKHKERFQVSRHAPGIKRMSQA